MESRSADAKLMSHGYKLVLTPTIELSGCRAAVAPTHPPTSNLTQNRHVFVDRCRERHGSSLLGNALGPPHDARARFSSSSDRMTMPIVGSIQAKCSCTAFTPGTFFASMNTGAAP